MAYFMKFVNVSRINYKPRNSANRSPTIVAFSIAININRATTN